MRLSIVLWLVLCLPCAARGHALNNSYLTLTIREAGLSTQHLDGQWRVMLRDLDAMLSLDADGDGQLRDTEVLARMAMLQEYLLTRLRLEAGSLPCEMSVRSHSLSPEHLTLRFEAACAVRPEGLTVRYDLFLDHDPTHQGVLQLLRGDEVRASVFTADDRVREFDLANYAWWRPALEYGVEGLWHIWIGYDHILFLLTLLLPAVLRREEGRWRGMTRWREALGRVLRIVTAFTVAHSITLTLGVFDVVQLPSRWVEAGIAASVVVASLNNVYPVVTTHGWVMALGFGLLHGFGFASALAGLDLPRHAMALAVLSFNLGVEFGQLAIVALCLPPLFFLRKRRGYLRWGMRAGSVAVALLASLWLVDRAVDTSLLTLAQRALRPEAMEQARALEHRGRRQLRRGRLAAARTAFEAALPLHRGLEDQPAVESDLAQLAEISLAQADLARAMRLYKELLAIAQARGDAAGEARAYRALSRCAELAREPAEAVRLLRRALELDEARGDSPKVAEDCMRLGLLYRETGQWTAGEASYERVIVVRTHLQDRQGLADAYARLGSLLQLRPDLPRAEAMYQKALRLDTGLDRPTQLANDHANLGTVLHLQGRNAAARDHYASARKLYEKLGSTQRARRVAGLLAGLAVR